MRLSQALSQVLLSLGSFSFKGRLQGFHGVCVRLFSGRATLDLTSPKHQARTSGASSPDQLKPKPGDPKTYCFKGQTP